MCRTKRLLKRAQKGRHVLICVLVGEICDSSFSNWSSCKGLNPSDYVSIEEISEEGSEWSTCLYLCTGWCNIYWFLVSQHGNRQHDTSFCSDPGHTNFGRDRATLHAPCTQKMHVIRVWRTRSSRLSHYVSPRVHVPCCCTGLLELGQCWSNRILFTDIVNRNVMLCEEVVLNLVWIPRIKLCMK